MANDSFGKMSKALQKAVALSTKQALSRAATSTRAEYAKEVSKELGIKSSTAKKRAKIVPPKINVPAAIVSIGTQYQLAAHEFKTAKIKLSTSKGIRYGATYAIGGKKAIAPAGVRAKGKNSGKTIVVTKISKGVYKTVKVDGFLETVKRQAPTLGKHMRETFNKNFNSALQFNLKKK